MAGASGIALAQALTCQGMAVCERLRSYEQSSISSALVRRPGARLGERLR